LISALAASGAMVIPSGGNGPHPFSADRPFHFLSSSRASSRWRARRTSRLSTTFIMAGALSSRSPRVNALVADRSNSNPSTSIAIRC
jgi:hypothetical protein